MAEKQKEDSVKLLEDIKDRLDILIFLSIPSFDESKYDFREDAQTQIEILKICEGKYSQEDMVKILDKTNKAVERALRKLIEKRLVKSMKLGDKTVYLRLK